MRNAADDAGGEDHVDGLEPDVVALDAGLADGVHEHGEQHDRRRQQHDRRQPVGDERDADRRRPVAGLHDGDAVVVDAHEDRRRRSARARSSVVSPMIRWAVREPPTRMHSAAASSGSTIGSGSRTLTACSAVDSASASPLGGAGVGDLGVGGVAADVAVVDVVLHLVVGGQQPAAVGEGEQQGGDAEADDDRRQHERLRQRVGEVGRVAGADQRRLRRAASR